MGRRWKIKVNRYSELEDKKYISLCFKNFIYNQAFWISRRTETFLWRGSWTRQPWSWWRSPGVACRTLHPTSSEVNVMLFMARGGTTPISPGGKSRARHIQPILQASILTFHCSHQTPSFPFYFQIVVLFGQHPSARSAFSINYILLKLFLVWILGYFIVCTFHLIVRLIKSRIIRWAGNVTRTEELGAFKILTDKPRKEL